MDSEKKLSYHSTSKRSMLKTATFWPISIAVDLLVFYFIFRKVETSLLVTAVGNITGFALYYVHERVWNKIHWGKRVQSS